MWVFSDFGLLMPAIVPAKHANDAAVLKWTNDGEYELQVRARLREHLEYFMTVYMEPGTFNPTIQATPDKDYNYRFYTTREAFAEGIKNVALNMDYEKFKVTSDRFAWNKKYHSLLTRIWGTLCELNTPGGIWGPRTKTNPTGYGSARSYQGGSSYAAAHDDYYGDYWGLGSSGSYGQRSIGSSFGPRESWEDDDWGNLALDEITGEVTDDSYLDDRREWTFNEDGEAEPVDDDDMSYTPQRTSQAAEIIQELMDYNIPFDQWEDSVLPHEWALVRRVVEPLLERKAEEEAAKAQEEAVRLAEVNESIRKQKRGNRRGNKGYKNRRRGQRA